MNSSLEYETEKVQLKNNYTSSASKQNFDVVDSPPTKITFGCWDISIYITSIIFFVLDVLTDSVLAYFYYSEGYLAYFGLTVCFTVIPSLTVTLISLKWYWSDRSDDHRLNLSNKEWVAVIILHFLQLGPVMRYYMTIKFGLISVSDRKEKQKYFIAMLWEATDVCLLRLIETFMESAPQLVLQLYILARNSQMIRWHYETAFIAGVPHNFIPADRPDTHLERKKFLDVTKNDPFLGTGAKTTVIFQAVSILISLTTLAWTLTAYARNARFVSEDKKNLSAKASICHFFWHFWTIAARVIAMALFASIFSFWIGVGCFLRWLFMVIWILSAKKNFCKGRCFLDFLFKCVIAFVYLFSFLNIIDESTKCKYLIFYCYEFLENCLYISLWFYFGDRHTWFYHLAIIGFWISCFLGMIFMLLYYVVFHPTKHYNLFFCCKKSIEKDTNANQLSRSSSRKEPHRVSYGEFIWVSHTDV